ncbi:MAG: 3-deoxy-D-manno-octulosonic acid transferase [Gemmataceae bacterium]
MTPLDIAYLTAMGLASPWLAARIRQRGAANLSAKFTGRVWRPEVEALRNSSSGAAKALPQRPHKNFRVWFHGVSVGEIHLLRTVVAAFRKHRPDCEVVISSTTDTGLTEARRTFSDLTVIPWPLDFSWAVRRAIREVQPDLIVLGESELWPGMLMAADAAHVPVVVINGRFSPKSASRYRRIAPIARSLLNRIAMFGMQSPEYAENLASLGVPQSRIAVTGSIKFDGVEVNRLNPQTNELRRLFGIKPTDIVWVAGSTQDPEEAGCIEIYKHLQSVAPNLRLILVPRQKDRFDDVAKLLRQSGLAFVRRSELLSFPSVGRQPHELVQAHGADAPRSGSPIILVDTIGELRAVWGLADIAFVGGSLDGQRGGQNMIEPAAYGCAVIFGKHVWNFKAVAEQLLASGGAKQVADFQELESSIQSCLVAEERKSLGQNAQQMVLSQQGATGRTLEIVDRFLPKRLLDILLQAG